MKNLCLFTNFLKKITHLRCKKITNLRINLTKQDEVTINDDRIASTPENKYLIMTID